MSNIARGNEEIFEYNFEDAKGIENFIDIPDKKYDENNDGLDYVSLRPEQAFEVFSGKIFGTTTLDYSYADLVERKVESPFQRFARLRAEINDLEKDLSLMQSTVCKM